ncbi:uncharacterized protein LOC116029650 [Ipomoea triloba]|uniref:uncharacterized protein LOC116029650 n=1 Tax=Ipomoea triloba TaxID=35885 RepID=UPI00125E4D50|nr:uncharacterized protein LOC116029650 [Ipomoea triloba]
MTETAKESVVQVLKKYRQIFAWGPEDMPGVDRSIITHRLAVDPTYRLVVQRKRHLSIDRREFVKKEIDALLVAGMIRRNPTSSGRLVKWAVALTQYGIEYQLRPAIKAQALADFIVECTTQDSKGNSVIVPDSEEWWEMHADGVSSQKHHEARVMLTTPEGFGLFYALEYQFKTSNNEVEYEAVLGGLRVAKTLGAKRLRIRTDSRLVVGQVKGTYEIKGERMRQYNEVTEGLLKEFQAYDIDHVPRVENSGADVLSKIKLGRIPEYLVGICRKEMVERPSIKTRDKVAEMVNEISQQGQCQRESSTEKKIPPKVQVLAENSS